MLDVVIVGGGPAGCTTGLSLLKNWPEGRGRVTLLERARYPRDKPCAGALGARGDALLRTLGVDIDVPGVRIDGIAVRCAAGEAVASPGAIGRVIRRIEFDHALSRAARERGVEVRDGVRVESVRANAEAGAVLETNIGALRARVVVGCDGVGSVVRKALGHSTGRLRAQVVEVDTPQVAGDLHRSLLAFDATDRSLPGYAWDFPTVVEGQPLVCRGVYGLKVEGERDAGFPDVAERLDARLRAQGIDPSGCKNKRYAERGFEPLARVAQGPLMLAGEAAGIDPVTGEGIAQAIEYGILAGAFVAERLQRTPSGPIDVSAWDDALQRSRLARDLRIRVGFLRMFYGPGREEVERFLVESSDPLRVGCQHFAAQAYDWLTVTDVVARGAARWLGFRIARALSG